MDALDELADPGRVRQKLLAIPRNLQESRNSQCDREYRVMFLRYHPNFKIHLVSKYVLIHKTYVFTAADT